MNPWVFWQREIQISGNRFPKVLPAALRHPLRKFRGQEAKMKSHVPWSVGAVIEGDPWWSLPRWKLIHEEVRSSSQLRGGINP